MRKWIARVERHEASPVRLLPVVAMPDAVEKTSTVWRHVVEVQVGDAVILIGENASSEVVRTIVRALR